jgi:RNA polymerase sigma factor (sigma-70 family)
MTVFVEIYMKNEKELLAENNLGLIHHVIKKYGLSDKFEDYFDLGLIGLASAINNFDENLGFKFSTFATDCIKKEILKEIDKNNCEKRLSNKIKVSLNFQLSKNINEDFTLEQTLKSDYNLEDEILKKELESILLESIKILTTREKQVIVLYFGLFDYPKVKSKQIAVNLNISKYRVYQLKSSGLKKIKKFLKKKGYEL